MQCICRCDYAILAWMHGSQLLLGECNCKRKAHVAARWHAASTDHTRTEGVEGPGASCSSSTVLQLLHACCHCCRSGTSGSELTFAAARLPLAASLSLRLIARSDVCPGCAFCTRSLLGHFLMPLRLSHRS